jgi:hypothetical protein
MVFNIESIGVAECVRMVRIADHCVSHVRHCSATRLSVVSDLAACSNTTVASHEYFYQTAIC